MADDHGSASRLAMEWHGEDEDMEAEFHFETTLWALVGMEKLRTRPVPPSQAPGLGYDPSGLYDVRDGMQVLCLGPVHGKSNLRSL
jgi:hypothetical protein